MNAKNKMEMEGSNNGSVYQAGNDVNITYNNKSNSNEDLPKNHIVLIVILVIFCIAILGMFIFARSRQPGPENSNSNTTNNINIDVHSSKNEGTTTTAINSTTVPSSTAAVAATNFYNGTNIEVVNGTNIVGTKIDTQIINNNNQSYRNESVPRNGPAPVTPVVTTEVIQVAPPVEEPEYEWDDVDLGFGISGKKITKYNGPRDKETLVVGEGLGNVVCVGEGVFEGMNFKNIIIPSDIYVIEARAFNNCRYLEHIEIGRDVYEIGEFAFGYSDYDYAGASQSLKFFDNLKTFDCSPNSWGRFLDVYVEKYAELNDGVYPSWVYQE